MDSPFRKASAFRPAALLLALPMASSQSNCMSSRLFTEAQPSNSVTRTSVRPLGSIPEHRERSTAGSAFFTSGDPTMRPCTLKPSLSLAPALIELCSGQVYYGRSVGCRVLQELIQQKMDIETGVYCPKGRGSATREDKAGSCSRMGQA